MQRHADQEQEAERQHLDGRMAMDELADRLGRPHHDADGDDDGRHHDPQLVDHADGRDHRVEREDDVEEHDLDDHAGERRRDAARRVSLLAFELLVDFVRALRQQEQAAEDRESDRGPRYRCRRR